MTTDVLDKPPRTEVVKAERILSERRYHPRVDILNRGSELLLLADLPRVRPDDVDIEFENGTLTIHGRMPGDLQEQNDYRLQEYGVADFYRTFKVSELIDADGITAEYANGVLTLHLPKVEVAKPLKITVNNT